MAGSTAAAGTQRRDRRAAGSARRRARRRWRDPRACRSTCRRRRSGRLRAAVRSWRGRPKPSSRHLSAAGPQSIAEVCTTSGARVRGDGAGLRPRQLPSREVRAAITDRRSHGTRITRIARARLRPAGSANRRGILKTSHAGRTRSTSISTVPGRAWLSGKVRPAGWSRRARRERGRRALRRRRASRCARRLPYSAHGKPRSRTRAGWPARTRPMAAAGANCATTRSGPSGTMAASRSPSSTTAPTRRSAASAMRPSIGARSTRRSTSYSKRLTVAAAVARLSLELATACRAAAGSVTRRSLSRVFWSCSMRASAAAAASAAALRRSASARALELFDLGDDTVGAQPREPPRLLVGEAERRPLPRVRAARCSSRAMRLARRSASTACSSRQDLLADGGDLRTERLDPAPASLSASRSASASSSTRTSPRRTTAADGQVDARRPRPSIGRPRDAQRRPLRGARACSFRRAGTRESRNQLAHATRSSVATAAVRQPRARSDSSARSDRENGLDMRDLYNLAFRFRPPAFVRRRRIVRWLGLCSC